MCVSLVTVGLLFVILYITCCVLGVGLAFLIVMSVYSMQKFAMKPMQAPQGFSSASPYMGAGSPSSMFMGVPPYGSSIFHAPSISPYEVPFPGGSAYPYNYGSRLSPGSPYRSLHLSGPAPYSSGPMMGNGMFCFSAVIIMVKVPT